MKYQYGFVDEAGETGRKFGQGSSTYFVIGLVLTSQPDTLRNYVHDFRSVHHLNNAKELRFRRTPDQNRISFLEPLPSMALSIHALVVNKPALPLEIRRLSKADFYTWGMAELVSQISGDLEEANVMLDELSNAQETIRLLRQRLRQKLSKPVYHQCIRRISMKPSHRDTGLQMADMITGAVYRYIQGGDSRFYSLIQSITTLWLR